MEALTILDEDLRKLNLTDEQHEDVMHIIKETAARRARKDYGPGSGNRNIFDRDVLEDGGQLDTRL